MANDQPALFAIHHKFSECINYASWQNSVPLLIQLAIENKSSEIYEDLELIVSTSPEFVRPKVWRIDRILPGDKIEIADRNVEIDPEYLQGLNEAERGVVKIELLDGDNRLFESNLEIRLLAKNEWGGMQASPELIAAFVTPNDPTVSKILKNAATILTKHGHADSLDGYQTDDPRRAYMLVAAIWSAIGSRDLTYANPPKSFEKAGQKTRPPHDIFETGLATCLDTSLLFASAIEAVGLNPIIVMTEGHCFAGAWLVESTLKQIIEIDSTEIRKALAANELITFETTQVAQNPPGRFEQAIKTAGAATAQELEHNFVAAIDIGRARMSGIRPLSSGPTEKKDQPESTETENIVPLAKVPDFEDTPIEESDEKPTTPHGRIDRWQRKLLDLSLRNKLLNFRQRKGMIPILCPNVAKLEDLLAAGKKLRMISLSDQNPIGDRDPELHRQKTNQDLNVEFAIQALEKKEVSCELPTDELQKRLTTIYRKVRNDMSEGGTNTLFLAVGFLRWRQTPTDKRTFRARYCWFRSNLLAKVRPRHFICNFTKTKSASTRL